MVMVLELIVFSGMIVLSVIVVDSIRYWWWWHSGDSFSACGGDGIVVCVMV